MNLDSYLTRQAKTVERALNGWVPRAALLPRRLHESMRYSLFSGGKRLRPALVLTVNQALGGRNADALPAACAVELIHTYSLIHDDLPAMDDDDFRRGKPSNHKAFDEATAILAGDALQTSAFEVIARRTPDSGLVAPLVSELAIASGSTGMVGGQQLDLDGEGDVHEIHARKTAALFTACARMGAIAARAPAPSLRRLSVYGRNLGLAFQIVDDILDVSGSAKELGKTPGKDARQGKRTFPAAYGVDESRRRAALHVRTARGAVQFLGERAERLLQIADFILKRTK